MRIIPISLPTPFYIGPVNVYVIAEDPLTIIDTGPKTKETIEALRAGLRKAGFLVSDLRRIVLTHAHEDHCGLAKSLRDEAKKAEVLFTTGSRGIFTAAYSTKSIVYCWSARVCLTLRSSACAGSTNTCASIPTRLATMNTRRFGTKPSSSLNREVCAFCTRPDTRRDRFRFCAKRIAR